MKYNSLEEIKRAIESPSVLAVSFDVFDTLLLRSTSRESDKFRLMDRTLFGLCGTAMSFAKIRTEAEAVLRRKIIRGEYGKEDCTIDEIYEVIEKEYAFGKETAEALKKEEIAWEHRLCRLRKSGKFLFDAARSAGKRILILSDMYLKEEQIRSLLEENGYEGFEKIFVSSEAGVRKMTGNLFKRAAQQCGLPADKILHIGDDPVNDTEQAEKCGLQAAYLPKTADVYQKYGCAHQAEEICSDLTNWEAALLEPGIGIFRQMAANYYFDDPFRSFDPGSDYNADPYFIGYAALSMEALALTRWIADQAMRDHAKKIVFLARDGYLPKQIYDRLRKYHPEYPPSGYLHTSRLAMLPVMIRTQYDLYDLPTDLTYQDPDKLLKLLEFCSVKDAKDRMLNAKEKNWSFGAPFTKETYHSFIADFIRYAYDPEKHASSKQRITEYLLNNPDAPLEDDTAVFDMGYSGRIAGALAEASKKKLFVYYFHGDGNRQFAIEKQQGIRIRTFFDFNPYMESTMREYEYLEPAPSCIGYSKEGKPLFDCGPAEHYADAVREMQKGALDAVSEFLDTFGEHEAESAFRYHNAAMTFEAFLRFCSPADRKIYDGVLIDDELWGGRRDIDLKKLMEARLFKMPDYAKDPEEK